MLWQRDLEELMDAWPENQTYMFILTRLVIKIAQFWQSDLDRLVVIETNRETDNTNIANMDGWIDG